MAHREGDDFDDDGYNTKVNDQIDKPNRKTTPLWIENFEPPPSPPIASLLEPPIDQELKPLFDESIDTPLVIPT